MASLPTNAGRVNPKSFGITNLDFGEVETRWRNASMVWSSWVSAGNVHRDYVHDVFHGRLLDNFHARKNSGELLPMTSFYKALHTLSIEGSFAPYVTATSAANPNYSREWRWKDGSQRVLLPPWNVHLGPGSYLATDSLADALGFSILDPALVQAAASKIYSRGWDAATFLAEFHLTVRMFRRVLYNLARLLDSFRGIGKRDALSTSLDLWLEGRYGWRILLYDIQDIIALISSLDKKSRSRNKERVGFQTKYTEDHSFVDSTSIIAFAINVNDVLEHTLDRRGLIVADFTPSRVILNPVTTAWEITKFSFVLDWIINVGAALEAMSFAVLADRYTAADSYIHTIERTVTCTLSDNNGRVVTYDGFSDFLLTETYEFSKRRPVLVPFLPRVNLNLSPYKIIDLLALVNQVLSKLS